MDAFSADLNAFRAITSPQRFATPQLPSLSFRSLENVSPVAKPVWASAWPVRPFQVSLYTTACDRLILVDDLATHAALTDAYLRSVARRLVLRACCGNELPWNLAREVLAFAQRAGYHPDPVGEEWLQPVSWTLSHGGDCEDLSELFVALARATGLTARLVWIEQENASLNHFTSQVLLPSRNAPQWYWGEASMDGARLGENPYDAVRRLGRRDVLGVR